MAALELLDFVRDSVDVWATRIRGLAVYDVGESVVYRQPHTHTRTHTHARAHTHTHAPLSDAQNDELSAAQTGGTSSCGDIAGPELLHVVTISDSEVNISFAMRAYTPTHTPTHTHPHTDAHTEFAKDSDIVSSNVYPSTDTHFPIPDILSAPYFRPEWLGTGLPRVLFAAVPDTLVCVCVGVCACMGRRVALVEPCRTWQPKVLRRGEAALEGFHDLVDASGVVDTAGLGSRLGLEAREYTLDRVRVDEAPICNKYWKYANGEATERVLRACIQHRPSACVRDATGAPVAWVLTRVDGTMGTLHTVAEHRGRGLAKVLVQAMVVFLAASARALAAKAAATEDPAEREVLRRKASAAALLHPFCHIVVGNTASETVFEKLGWHPVENVSWVIAAEPTPRMLLRPVKAEPPHDRRAELTAVLSLINASYREDDEFFVDMVRTDIENVERMASNGLLFVGYELEAAGAPSSMADAAVGFVQPPFDRSSSLPVLPDCWRESSRLLACVHLATKEDAATGTLVAQLSFLTVASSAKRSGVGQRVLAFALEAAKHALDCDAVEAYVVSVKPWLLAWYQKAGFHVVGTEPWPTEPGVVLKQDVHFIKIRKSLR